jgi:hypothetical protein
MPVAGMSFAVRSGLSAHIARTTRYSRYPLLAREGNDNFYGKIEKAFKYKEPVK